jgi:hypothetical protein
MLLGKTKYFRECVFTHTYTTYPERQRERGARMVEQKAMATLLLPLSYYQPFNYGYSLTTVEWVIVVYDGTLQY